MLDGRWGDAAPLDTAEAEALLSASFAPLGHVVLAVSGGSDSMALLTLAAGWAEGRPDAQLSVATVDHGLRPESRAEAAAVAERAASLRLPHTRLDAPPARPAARVEEAARDGRYAALLAHAAAIGADAVATAHTLNDQAETVLMRLAAGSGPAGLAAMRPRSLRGHLTHLRPFLGVPKARLVATLRARGLGWSEDAMNADPAFCRARLRRSARALANEGLTPERLGVFAVRAARAEDALAAMAEAAAEEHLAIEPGRATLGSAAARLPDEIRLRLLARAVAAVGGGRVRLDRLERLFARLRATEAGAATLAGARIAWTPAARIVVTAAAPRRSVASRPAGG